MKWMKFAAIANLGLILLNCSESNNPADSGASSRTEVSSSTLSSMASTVSSVVLSSSERLSSINISSVSGPSISSAIVNPSSMVVTSSSVSEASSASTGEHCDTQGNCGTFIDERDGREYRWTKIGSQVWMAENLAFLPSVNAKDDISTSDARYYVYRYDGTDVSQAKANQFYTIYGVLYNWISANNSCPLNWHLSSENEWKALEANVGGATTAGIKLRAPSNWSKNDGIAGTDDFDFSALPGGFGAGSDPRWFDNNGYYGYWWASTANSSDTRYWAMGYDFRDTRNDSGRPSAGYSVRCIQDYQ